jgi:thymidylate kinase
MRRGQLIALSGVDCAGKTTQRELLFTRLWFLRRQPVTLWSRAGYTPALEALKRAAGVLRGRKKRPRTGVSAEPSRYPRRAADLGSPLRRWLWLNAALLDLVWVYGVRVRVLRALGRTVICDRYLLDCLVDFRVNFPEDRVEQRWLWRALRTLAVRPDTALCFVIPPERTLERAQQKSRFHRETLEVLERRWRAYRVLSSQLDVEVLDGLRPADEIAGAVWRSVAHGLPAPELRLRGSH